MKSNLTFERQQAMNKARGMVRRGISKGTIIKPKTCGFCDSPVKIEAHHHKGYDNPMSFVWLCRKCHMEAHVAIRKLTLESVG